MKKLIIKDKLFKIIPEAKLVIGTTNKKYIEDDFNHGVRREESYIISDAANCLGIHSSFDWFKDDDTTVYANAYCDERDEWDEKRGMEVCSSKLDMKNHLRLAKQYSRIYRLLQETAATVYRLCKMHVNKAQAIEDDLVNHYGRMKV